MDDFLMLLQAKLDEAKSKSNVNADIDKLQTQLDKLKVQATLDPKSAQNLANEIGKLVNQKIVLSNINVDTSGLNKSGQKAANDFSNGMSQGLKKSSNILNSFKKSLKNMGMGSKEIDAVAERIGGLVTEIQSLNQTRTSGKKDILSIDIAGIDKFGQAIKLTQQYDVATGKLIKNIDAVSTAQEKVGISTNSLKKAENVFADYTAKISQFKSTNSNILSGLTDPLSDFENKLAGLKNGTSTVDDVINSYKNLNSEASKITANLSAQFNKVDSAVRNIAKGSETIASLKADFKGLSNSPKEINTELSKCEKLLQNVKNIESQEGRTANWSAAYKEWEESVNSLTAKIQVLKKEQSNVASTQIFNTSDLKEDNIAYITKVYNTIEKQMASIQSMAHGKGWEVVDVSGVEQADGKIKQLTLTVKDAEGALKKLTMQREKLQGNGKAQYGLIQVGDVKVIETATRAQEKLAQSAEKANAKLAEQVNKIQLSIGENGDITSQVKVIRDNFTKLGLSADEVSSKMNGVDKELIELKTLINSGASDAAITSQFDKMQSVLKETQNDLKTTRSEYSLLVSAQQRLNKANAIEAWRQKNSAATKQAKADTQAYIDTLRNLNVQMTKMEFEQISRGFKETENSMRGLHKLGASLKDQISQAAQSFTQWLSVSSVVMALVYQLQRIPKEVIKVNAAMIELEKVSNSSHSEIKKYFDEASESAKKYGSAVSDMINATADWSRLGYNLQDAKKLAEVATLYTNVGDGIDMSNANESLISTLQGFKMTADEAIHVIDSFNEVANTEAIDSAGIGEALKRSASSMYAAGNTLEETIGLVTAANAVVQDPDSIGTAYKTISMRIRGAKTEMEELGLETDGMVESTATLQAEIMALSGVDIMKDKDTFKSTYQILDELATKWQDLTDIQQASITELIAGKRQGNIISALMNNFDTARRATETAVNSTGSALEEQEKYEKGIQYSLDRLKASFQAFANHIIDSNFVKGIVDFGSGTIEVIDKITSKLGSLGTIGLGAGIFAGVKNAG